MNPSTLLHNSFQLDGPITTDSDYPGPQRHYPGSTGFPMDDEDSSRRSNAVGNPLTLPVSIPASNTLKYNTQQPAMQDVPFATSPPTLMSPSDSCSDAFSPGSLYSHSPGLPYDRMPDFRSHRVAPLQPSIGIPSTVQPQGNPFLYGKNDNYHGAYSMSRGTFPSLSGIGGDLSRVPPYTSTPRALDCPLDRSQNLMFTQTGNMFVDHVQRVPPPMADAPPFHETSSLRQIIAGNQTIRPEIGAKIHKGFFQVDGKWTCYRRNYFSISCSFSFHPPVHGPIYLKYDQRTERIRHFSMSISAIVNEQYGEVRELVQHSPKRDKQSERPPPKVALQPCNQQGIIMSHGSASHGGQHGFPLMSQSSGMAMEYNSSFSNAQQPSQPPMQHTFDRIQFQKATANNGKRRAQQQYYNLVVDLYAEVGNEWVKIARKLSHPMVVRGRSPGHYKDGRRDSSTSMGPDPGNGGPGDGSWGAVLPPGLGQATRSHLALTSYDLSQRGGQSYGRNDYHQMGGADQSPLSESPHISSSSSSNFDIGMMNESLEPIDSIKSTTSMDSCQEPGYVIVDSRKESPFRNHLPPFDYEPGSKAGDEKGFPEAYDSMMPMAQDDSSPFLKHPPRMTSQAYHPSPSGYDSLYSARSGSPYCQVNSQSLCA